VSKISKFTSGHKVEPKIEQEVVPIKINTERTERFFFVAIKRRVISIKICFTK
jgi:hypothetical protein